VMNLSRLLPLGANAKRRHHRAANQHDELPALHSTTSSELTGPRYQFSYSPVRDLLRCNGCTKFMPGMGHPLPFATSFFDTKPWYEVPTVPAGSGVLQQVVPLSALSTCSAK
jgi:hypothetical protein